MALLVLPGALYVLAGLLAVRLGHRARYVPDDVTRFVTGLAGSVPQATTLVIHLAVLLPAAIGAGLAVQALGAAFTRCGWPNPVIR